MINKMIVKFKSSFLESLIIEPYGAEWKVKEGDSIEATYLPDDTTNPYEEIITILDSDLILNCDQVILKKEGRTLDRLAC